MKRIKYTIITLLFPLFLTAQGTPEYYYYYKGEKQPLELNTEYLFFSSTEKQMRNADFDQLTHNGYLQRADIQKELNSDPQILNYYWSEVKLNRNINKKSYLNIVKSLSEKGSVKTVSPYFKTKNSDKIGLSNFFYVKLKQLSDTTLLRVQANEYSCKVVKQDKYMPLWFVLSITERSKLNALEAANLFYESKLFQSAEPDLMVDDIINCANDTYFSNQWGLRNTGQNGGTASIDIKACNAWNISKGANVVVAVLDDGIELNHPDLQTNIHTLSYDTETGSTPSTVRSSHGTACAGIIGADDNNIGISGVAPDCQLMSISNSFATTPLSRMKRGEGINWAVNNGAQVISNSWSSAVQYAIIDDAITNAVTNGRNGLGCVVVFASGNNNSYVSYPANSNPHILTVGAISQCGQRKSSSSCDGENWGSNYGSQLDVVAPGVKIYTTDINRNYQSSFNGTSAACPHVAGVAALMLSVRPDLTGQQVRDVIEQTAQKVGDYSYTTHSGRPNGNWNNEMGYGLIDAHAAVKAVVLSISGPSTICDQATYTVENLPTGATVHWSLSNSNLMLISGQGTGEATFRKNGNGKCNILAKVEYKGVINRLSTNDLWVAPTIGSYSISLSEIGGTGQYYTNQSYYLYSIPNDGIELPPSFGPEENALTSFRWTIKKKNNSCGHYEDEDYCYTIPIDDFVYHNYVLECGIVNFQTPGRYKIELEISLNSCGGNVRSFPIFINVSEKGEGWGEMSYFLSPNGDGVNDTWEVGVIKSMGKETEGFRRAANIPVYNVAIFNSQGAMVYQKDNYMQDRERFSGIGNVGSYLGKFLPNGNYFFTIKGSVTESGSLYIKRE